MRLHKFFCSNVRCFLSRFILDVTAYTSKRSVTHVLHIKIYPFFLLDLQKSDRFLVVPCHVGIQFSLDAHPFIFLHFLWPWWKRIAFLEFFFSLSKSCKKSFFMWVFHARSFLDPYDFFYTFFSLNLKQELHSNSMIFHNFGQSF